MPDNKANPLERAAANGKLPFLLNRYLESCRPPPSSQAGGNAPRVFPNLAGFCRSLRCGINAAEELRQSYPEVYDRLCAVLEDEALNYPLSPTVLTAYLKRRLGYADQPQPVSSVAECEQLRLIFDHDILEDGA